jgi:hypothetical protein
MLCQLQQETDHREGFDLSLEEFVVGSVVDHGGLSVLPNAYLFQTQRWAGDVLGESLSCLRGSGGDVHRSIIHTESGVPPIDQTDSDLGTDWLLLQDELDDRPAKVLRHPVEVPEGDMHEPAGFIKSPLPKRGSGNGDSIVKIHRWSDKPKPYRT